jgi:hypothetical protein
VRDRKHTTSRGRPTRVKHLGALQVLSRKGVAADPPRALLPELEAEEREDRLAPEDERLLPASRPRPHAARPEYAHRRIAHHGSTDEQLVDELPRERRRGALTALVNALLAEHAPRNVADARNATTWLRRAEAQDAAAETRIRPH